MIVKLLPTAPNLPSPDLINIHYFISMIINYIVLGKQKICSLYHFHIINPTLVFFLNETILFFIIF